MSHFAENIKKLRKLNKISLEELGNALNISKSAISDYENDKYSPTLAICSKLANYFGTTIDRLENSIITEKSIGSEDISDELIKQQNLLQAEIKTTDYLKNEIEKMAIEIRVQQQKIDSLQLQLRLHSQLKDSKMSEIELLKTQIKLLEEKILLITST